MEEKLSVSESLEKYFNETPQEQLDKDWEELKHWNDIGPDAREYIEFCKRLGENDNENDGRNKEKESR